MHELSITEDILSIVLAQAEANNAKKVTRVNLKIGKMATVVSDCVRFYFELMSKDTIAKGAEVKIEEVPIKGKCFLCKGEFEMDELCLVCPKCQAIGVEVVSGKELCVESIEIE